MSSTTDPWAEPKRKRSGLWFFVGLTCLLLVVYGVVAAALAWGGGSGRGSTSRAGRGLGALSSLGDDRIGVINITGVIMASSQAGMLGNPTGAGGSSVIRQVRKAAADSSIKAVVLRINSPGGAAAASQEIYEEVLKARKRKPFVCSMADVAASGGYYVASACNRIVANRATATGSIGVIMSGMNYSGLMQRYDVKDQTITSGKFKAIGSATRPMSAEARALLQGLVDNTYQQFVGDVAKGRGLPVATIAKVADGRVMTGEQAKARGLVDVLGGFWVAVEEAQKLAKMKVKGEPNIYRFDKVSWLEDLLESRSPAAPPQARLPLPVDASPAGGALLWFLAPGVAPQLLQ